MALTISNGQINFKRVNGLDKYSEYECQVLAFTTIGDDRGVLSLSSQQWKMVSLFLQFIV